MIAFSLEEIADITGGRLDGPPGGRVTGPVVVDSRLAGPGSLFVAVRGEHADGHDFARAAVDAGAAGVLAERPVGVPAVVVPDVLAGLAALARAVVDRLTGLTVVGITGSSGKTSTKDLLAQVVGGLGATVAAEGSFNNEIGHPLTVLRADRSTRYLVLEVAARGAGHIAYLCRVAPPRIGVVLNVGSAHIGEFGGREEIAKAKGELVEALPPAAAAGGVAVLNADDPLVAAMADRTRARVVTFGRSDSATVRASGVTLDAAGRAAFTLVAPAGQAPVRLALVGEHQVDNALATAAVAAELGMAPAAIAAALEGARPRSRWRMEVTGLPDGTTVVNDAYNANPESVTAALRTLAVMAGGGRGHAVLGQMAELGPAHRAEHERIGRLAAELGVTCVIAVGPEAAPIAEAAAGVPGWSGTARTVPDAAAAVRAVREELRPGDVVLVKGSRVAALEKVADELVAGGDAR
ncbi:MAG: UDP-N-acetylmuramoyl-tripeptide--D-alanyl-D-alanine ligase [Streptosporangiales bacterium]|nr:UDP-N-acetylmuramoyl-tripeptide--D-alanyl-D-alanine ligase [Streptosporangiales bacterium]